MGWTLFGRNWLTGIICMWSGLLVDIPNGWALCDGSNGTPDLRDKFVVGAPAETNPGGTGGTSTHRHTTSGASYYEDSDHRHAVEGRTYAPDYDSSGAVPQDNSVVPYETHNHEVDLITSESEDDHYHFVDLWSSWVAHLPPYYEIAFIMKL